MGRIGSLPIDPDLQLLEGLQFQQVSREQKNVDQFLMGLDSS